MCSYSSIIFPLAAGSSRPGLVTFGRKLSSWAGYGSWGAVALHKLISHGGCSVCNLGNFPAAPHSDFVFRDLDQTHQQQLKWGVGELCKHWYRMRENPISAPRCLS
ncbi:Hypothetical_protein [Hexamita inflata]|uniref:Hypothetical_protein n=1 Tax=Hexamita inflata TaxID=28002 RepID=A0AA86NPA1_9EUKA|nr:Hypothetical protein HINF_LOCUS1318 [Hexamita inflata]CAI9922623.1 Hypothetical protein HINF_LOCUS10268 [Hexamita inflata]CAI9938533.1 Hypothetical protein HINF_LOCUS26178 [Hexamita inflata]